MEVILEGKAYEITQNEDGTFSLPKELERLRGLGTQLKPSWEPALIARKPIVEKTVAKQVLKTGTGAMNIDACRVGLQGIEEHSTAGPSRIRSGCTVYGTGEVSPNHLKLNSLQEERLAQGLNPRYSPSGRWPANLLLTHSAGCKLIGTTKVKAPVINRFTDGAKPFGNGAGHEYTSIKTGDADGNEAVSVYDCEEGCPVDALDQQAGIRKTSGGALNRSGIGFQGGSDGNETFIPPSEGTASRFFQNFECEDGCPIKELDEQSGISKSVGGRTRNITGSLYGDLGKNAGMTAEEAKGDPGFGDEGGASRYFQNFTYECEPGCAVKELDGQGWEYDRISHGHDDEESASRFFGQFQPEAPFFYATKVSKKERNKGLGQPLVQLRKDLTPQERDYVLEQLRAAGVVGVEASHAAIPQE